MKKRIRLAVDIAMVCILPMLMAYSLIGEKFHEIIGTIMLLLFIVHHILNLKWYKAIPKGKYTVRRIFQTSLDVCLLIVMILQPASGILMSKHLYTFLPVLSVSAKAREIHMIFAYWGFVLMSIHAGTHFTQVSGKLKQNKKGLWCVVLSVISVLSIYGIYAFIKRGFPGYMSGRASFAFFDLDEPRIFFFLDYIAIMVLFMMMGCLTVYGLGKISAKRKAVRK